MSDSKGGGKGGGKGSGPDGKSGSVGKGTSTTGVRTATRGTNSTGVKSGSGAVKGK